MRNRKIEKYHLHKICVYVKDSKGYYHHWIDPTRSNIAAAELGRTICRIYELDILKSNKGEIFAYKRKLVQEADRKRLLEIRNNRFKKELSLIRFISDCKSHGYDKNFSQISLEKSTIYFSDEILSAPLLAYETVYDHGNFLVNIFLEVSKLNAQRVTGPGTRFEKKGDLTFWCEKMIPGSYDLIVKMVKSVKKKHQNEDILIAESLFGINTFSKYVNPKYLPKTNALLFLKELILKLDILNGEI